MAENIEMKDIDDEGFKTPPEYDDEGFTVPSEFNDNPEAETRFDEDENE